MSNATPTDGAREELKKQLEPLLHHCESCWSDNCFYDEGGEISHIDICCNHQSDKWLALLADLISAREAAARDYMADLLKRNYRSDWPEDEADVLCEDLDQILADIGKGGSDDH